MENESLNTVLANSKLTPWDSKFASALTSYRSNSTFIILRETSSVVNCREQADPAQQVVRHGSAGRVKLMFLYKTVIMRTTVDLPEALFRKTKATAALRGFTMKELIVQALEKEVEGQTVAKNG